ncbi:hypothetical protein BGHDH14_bghG004010000003001 [Blumeria hordei DH14]|uniref:Uncharacterized protein n=1 Tax=Blumeria graminis f. sp. hordei (strain DH14) TaxID=546991 RepID=N1JIX8_BLUG1|nr:hypothetical protein BGHDH14_bghG004010000003001 [Blumeria hordei DH14]
MTIHLLKPSQIQSAQTTTGYFPSKDQKYDNKFESSRSITPSRDLLTQSVPSMDPTRDQKSKVKFEPQYPTIGYSRELSALSKMCDPDLKYLGDNDSFDFKLNIFFELCDKADIPEPLYGKTYLTMLSGPTLTHYYSVTSNSIRIDFDKLFIVTRDYFEDCLMILVKVLRFLQLSLDLEYRTDKHLYLKLINACRSIPACQLACFKPSETVNDLINDIQASISTSNQNDEAPTPQYFTDRRYHDEIHRENTQPSKHPFFSRNQKNSSRSHKKCYVCNRTGCWSKNHTESERNDAKRDFKKRLHKRFDKRAEQFLARMEDNQYDLNSSDSNLNEQIETLILDTRNPSECLNEVEENGDIFITFFGLVQEANDIILNLADRSFQYQVTSKDLAIEVNPTDNDPFTYIGSGRYNSDCFYGIIIDTGASKHSTAGYKQFLAYQKSIDVTRHKSKAGAITVQFGIGSSSSIGFIWATTPTGKIEFHVVEADTPFLLSLSDMDNLSAYYNNLKNLLVTPTGSVSVMLFCYGGLS